MRATMVSQIHRRISHAEAVVKPELDRSRGLADDKTYKAEYLGSGTFVISKPKRKRTTQRQSQLKNPQRGARK